MLNNSIMISVKYAMQIIRHFRLGNSKFRPHPMRNAKAAMEIMRFAGNAVSIKLMRIVF
jgi:hypothetical protein